MRDELRELMHRTGLNESDVVMLHRLPLFSGLKPADLVSLLRDARVQRFPRNVLLFNQGDQAERFYVVLDGWVRLFRLTPDGNEVTIHLFTNGESFAEAALFATARYPVNGMTADETRLLTIPAGGFLGALAENHDLGLNMMASMARRLHGFVQQIEQISYRSTVERLAAFLLRLSRVEKGPATYRLPLDKNLIAARLGMQPETLSRSFAKLRTAGVRTAGDQVEIDDVEALKRMLSDE